MTERMDSGLVDRSQLIESGLQAGILVLAAPTGFGKTRLMAQHKVLRENLLAKGLSPSESEATEQGAHPLCLWLDGVRLNLQSLHVFLAELKPQSGPPLTAMHKPCLYLDNWQAVAIDVRQRLLSTVQAAPIDVVIATRDPCDADLLPGGGVMPGHILTVRQLRLNFSDVEQLSYGKPGISNSRLFRETLGWPLALGLALQGFSHTGRDYADFDAEPAWVDALARDIRLQSALWQALSPVLSETDWQRLLTLTLFPSIDRDWFDAFEQGAVDELLHRRLSGLFLRPEDQFALLPLVRQALSHLGFRYLESQYRQLHLQVAERRAAAGDIATGIELMLGCGERTRAARLLSQRGGLLEWIRHGLGNLEQILSLFDDGDTKRYDEVAWLSVIVNFKRGRVDQARRMVNRHWHNRDSFEWSLADALIRLYEGRIVARDQLDFLRSASQDKASQPYATALANNILALVALQQGELQTAGECLDSARVAYHRELEAEYGETYLDIHEAHLALLNQQAEVAGNLINRVSAQIQTLFSQDLSIRVALQGVKRELAFNQGLLPAINAIGQLIRKLNRSEAWFDLYAAIYTLATRSAIHHDRPDELLSWLARASKDSHKRSLAYLETLLSYLARLALTRWPEREPDFQSYIKPLEQDPFIMPWRLQQLHLEWSDIKGIASDDLCLQMLNRAEAGHHLWLQNYCCWLLALRADDQEAISSLWRQLDEQGWVGMAWLLKHRLTAAQLNECLHRHNRTRLLQATPKDACNTLLSGREVAVMELVRRGHRNKQIALELDISEQTVKFHLKNIYRKLGVKGRRHAVAALSAGLPNFN